MCAPCQEARWAGAQRQEGAGGKGSAPAQHLCPLPMHAPQSGSQAGWEWVIQGRSLQLLELEGAGPVRSAGPSHRHTKRSAMTPGLWPAGWKAGLKVLLTPPSTPGAANLSTFLLSPTPSTTCLVHRQSCLLRPRSLAQGCRLCGPGQATPPSPLSCRGMGTGFSAPAAQQDVAWGSAHNTGTAGLCHATPASSSRPPDRSLGDFHPSAGSSTHASASPLGGLLRRWQAPLSWGERAQSLQLGSPWTVMLCKALLHTEQPGRPSWRR